MKVLLWGNSLGTATYLHSVGGDGVVGLVGAGNRPLDTKLIRQVAGAYELPLYVQPYRREEARYRGFLESLRQAEADLFIVNCYSMILDESVLAYPPQGAFNVHLGLLPQYRGANVLNWVLVNGE